MDSTRRIKLREFDARETALTERIGKLKWNVWHGRNQDYHLLKKAHEDLAELPGRLRYYDDLKAARGETTDIVETREMEVRMGEALFNAVRRDPEVNAQIEKAAEQLSAFRYEFVGVTLTAQQIRMLWQSQADQRLALAIHLTYLEQSAALKSVVLRVVEAVNRSARRAGKELALEKIESFVDVLLMRNEVDEALARNRFCSLLDYTQNAKAFLDQIKAEQGVERVTVLNDHRLVGHFLDRTGFFSVFPTGQPAMELFRGVLRLAGFENVNGAPYLDIDNFGNEPYLIDIDPPGEIGAEEGAFRFGRGIREYAAVVNPFISPNPRVFTKALFHEGGHILHYDGMDRQDMPDFFKNDSEAFNEGMAVVVAGLLNDPVALSLLTGFTDERLGDLQTISEFLDTALMREHMIGGLFELDLYRTPEAALDQRYAELSRQYSLLDEEAGVQDRIGGSWGSDSMLALQPGGRTVYGLGFAIANAVLESLTNVGGISALQEATAPLLVEHCYIGSLAPWPLRVEKMLRDCGMSVKPVLH